MPDWSADLVPPAAVTGRLRRVQLATPLSLCEEARDSRANDVAERGEGGTYVAPRSPVEQVLAGIW